MFRTISRSRPFYHSLHADLRSDCLASGQPSLNELCEKLSSLGAMIMLQQIHVAGYLDV